MAGFRTLLSVIFISASLFTQGKEILKPGYIITRDGDTIRGNIEIPKDLLGSTKMVGYFSKVSFTDSMKVTRSFLPGDLKGYGISDMPDFKMQVIGDDKPTLMTNWSLDPTGTWHFISSLQLPMQGAIGKVKKDVFVMRQLQGKVSIYYLYREVFAGSSTNQLEEYYLLKEGDKNLNRIKVVNFKLPVRYHADELGHLFAEWPEQTKYFGKDLPMEDIFIGVIRYNEWADQKSVVSSRE